MSSASTITCTRGSLPEHPQSPAPVPLFMVGDQLTSRPRYTLAALLGFCLLASRLDAAAESLLSPVACGSPFIYPGSVAVSPERTTLYVSDWGSNAIFSVSVTGGPPALIASFDSTSFDGLLDPRFITISPDGSMLYVAGYGSGTLFSIATDTGTPALLSAGLDHPHGIAVTTDGSMIYFTENLSGRIFRVPSSGGNPLFLNPDALLRGAYDIAVSPDQTTLYITSDSPPGVYRMSTAGGSPVSFTPESPLVRPTGISISADGETLFIVDDVGTGNGGLPVIYTLPSRGGALLPVQTEEPLRFPADAAPSPDGTLFLADPGYGEEGCIYRISANAWKPELHIDRSGTNVVLTWPAWGSNFVLEETSLLRTSAIWAGTTNLPELSPSGTNLMVTLPAGSRSKFYRLKRQ